MDVCHELFQHDFTIITRNSAAKETHNDRTDLDLLGQGSALFSWTS